MATAAQQLTLPSVGAQPDRAHGSVEFVGTATVILRYAGFTILTDPNFLHKGDHIHLGYGLTATRRTDPAVELDALPPIDFVLLSHLHADHFDRVVEERLDRELPVVTTRSAARKLAAKGFRRTIGLDTWDTLAVAKGGATVKVTAMPGKHAPGVLAPMLPSVMGSMVEFDDGRGGASFRLYISGDTLLIRDLNEIPRRYPQIDLALVHLGGTTLLGLVMVTLDPKQGVELIRLIGPKVAIPIHYDDYTAFKKALGETSSPPADDPHGWWKGTEVTSFDDFIRMAREAAPGTDVHILRRGETYGFEVPESRR